MATVHLICGFLGAGKTTSILQLAERLHELKPVIPVHTQIIVDAGSGRQIAFRRAPDLCHEIFHPFEYFVIHIQEEEI